MSRQETFARPYAKAVFELAQQENDFLKWSNMLQLAAEIAQDKDVADLMRNPQFSREALMGIFVEIGKNVFSPQMQSLLQLLSQFKRLQLLPAIHEIYEQMRAQAERLINIELISAYPIEEEQKKRFISALEKRMNRQVNLACVVDKNILGGAIIRAGDVVIDGSIQGRLAKLGDAMGIN